MESSLVDIRLPRGVEVCEILEVAVPSRRTDLESVGWFEYESITVVETVFWFR